MRERKEEQHLYLAFLILPWWSLQRQEEALERKVILQKTLWFLQVHRQKSENGRIWPSANLTGSVTSFYGYATRSMEDFIQLYNLSSPASLCFFKEGATMGTISTPPNSSCLERGLDFVFFSYVIILKGWNLFSNSTRQLLTLIKDFLRSKINQMSFV